MSRASSHPALANINSLADAVYDALRRDDIPRAMQLAWHLMQQPSCPFELQAQAVLVHSAASLTLGGDPDVIEDNLQNMFKRLSSTLSRLPKQGAEVPWNVKALGQLHAAVTALRNARKAGAYRSSQGHIHGGHPPPHAIHPNPYSHKRSPLPSSIKNCLDLDTLIEDFGRLDVTRFMSRNEHDVMIHQEDYYSAPWKSYRA
ncbi:hypothetical protein Clacol_009913 [Clathrus columnatus]|uniref:Uncharacterized protein n=1 Tax=Clathrus columnatus TaxID=1419009 RepID=A0AAV5ASB6_9AGAM|nr:hypothetical protein Clacol_009913 [Clathrus columnatus]